MIQAVQAEHTATIVPNAPGRAGDPQPPSRTFSDELSQVGREVRDQPQPDAAQSRDQDHEAAGEAPRPPAERVREPKESSAKPPRNSSESRDSDARDAKTEPAGNEDSPATGVSRNRVAETPTRGTDSAKVEQLLAGFFGNRAGRTADAERMKRPADSHKDRITETLDKPGKAAGAKGLGVSLDIPPVPKPSGESGEPLPDRAVKSTAPDAGDGRGREGWNARFGGETPGERPDRASRRLDPDKTAAFKGSGDAQASARVQDKTPDRAPERTSTVKSLRDEGRSVVGNAVSKEAADAASRMSSPRPTTARIEVASVASAASAASGEEPAAAGRSRRRSDDGSSKRAVAATGESAGSESPRTEPLRNVVASASEATTADHAGDRSGSLFSDWRSSVDVELPRENFSEALGRKLAGDASGGGELGDAILRRARLLVREGSGEIRLVLKPEDLGHVRIRLHIVDNHVEGRILVENSSVRQAFQENLANLSEALARDGLEVGDLSVAVGGREGGDNDGDRQPGRRAAVIHEFDEHIPSADGSYSLAGERLVNLVV